MKKGMAVSTFPTSFGPLVFSGNLERSLPTVKELGYDGIDLFIKRPDEPGLSEILALISDLDLEIPVLAAVSALVDEGLSLSHPDESIRKELIERMSDQIALAGKLGAKVPIGLIRGSAVGGEAPKTAFERLASSIRELLPFALQHNVDLLLEPVNRYETNLINSVDEALDFVESYDLDLGILLDTFHMNIEDPLIEASILQCSNRIGHVHFVDSNRWSAGAGHLNLVSIFQTLRHVGYEGYLTSEALPLPDPLTSARRAAQFMENLFLD
jgi:sugar phosphate isomerase/epimerase